MMANKVRQFLYLVPLILLHPRDEVNAQAIARLYAHQAPAGYSYVRVINASSKVQKVSYGGKQDVLDPAQRMASDYRAVSAAKELLLIVDGRTLSPLKIPADQFVSVVLQDKQPLVIVDNNSGQNAMKAGLKFYNIAPNCKANLALMGGAKIFEGVAMGESRFRTINPIKAQIQGDCGKTSTDVALPPLNLGDQVSFFLVGDAIKPRLVVQVDATEAFEDVR